MSGHSESDSPPDFLQVINFPQYVGKKARNCKKFCVMCGQARPVVQKTSPEAVFPAMLSRRNQGVCTACDMTAWNVVESNLVVKWCNGRCQNFLPLGAFGGHRLSAKTCIRCLEDQYSTDSQKNALQEKPTRVEQLSQNKAPQEKPSGVMQSCVSLAPLKATEQSETPEVGAVTQSQRDDGSAQVHDNDVGRCPTDTVLTACMYRCEPLEGPIPSG